MSETSRRNICLCHSLQLTFISHSLPVSHFAEWILKVMHIVCFSKISTEYVTEGNMQIYLQATGIAASLSSVREKNRQGDFQH